MDADEHPGAGRRIEADDGLLAVPVAQQVLEQRRYSDLPCDAAFFAFFAARFSLMDFCAVRFTFLSLPRSFALPTVATSGRSSASIMARRGAGGPWGRSRPGAPVVARRNEQR